MNALQAVDQVGLSGRSAVQRDHIGAEGALRAVEPLQGSERHRRPASRLILMTIRCFAGRDSSRRSELPLETLVATSSGSFDQRRLFTW